MSTKPKKAKASPPARPHTKPRDWVLSAYIAARVLTERLSSPKQMLGEYSIIGAWDDVEAAAARILYMRAHGVAAQPTDEITHGSLPRPAGFTTWAKAAKRLEELAVPELHDINGPAKQAQNGVGIRRRGPCSVSPYEVRMATSEAEPLFDSRALYKPRQEFLDSIEQFGGTFERIKLLPLRDDDGGEVLWVEDGRQRLNGVRQFNQTVIIEWYRKALSTGQGHDLPPAVISTMPAEIRDEGLKAGMAVAAASNNQRRQDAQLILAERAGLLRAPTVGAGGEEVPGYHQAEIATILGVSRQTVANFLLLQDLAPPLWLAVRAGTLPISCAYLLAPLEHERQVDLWAQVSEGSGRREPGRQREHLRALIEGREINRPVAKPRLVPELQRIRERLNGLEGNGPLVARAVLDWALGVCGPEVFTKFPDELQRQFNLSGNPVAPTVGAERPALSRPRGKKGDRAGVDGGWAAFKEDERDAWEVAGVFDSRKAHDLYAANITTEQAGRVVLIDGRSASCGAHYSHQRITIAGIKTMLRQQDLPISANAGSEADGARDMALSLALLLDDQVADA